jgi:hypothetical protein
MARFSAQRIALLAACLLPPLAHAQTAAPQEDPSTLHVYVNLVQIPVLILNSSLHPIARVPDGQFNVAIEGLGRIKPARIRLEGDDPIDLTLLVDRSVRDDGLWNDLPKSLDPLIQSLQPHDHLTVFAMDGCKARRLGEEMVAFEEDKLRLSVASAMELQPYWAGHHLLGYGFLCCEEAVPVFGAKTHCYSRPWCFHQYAGSSKHPQCTT